MMLDYYTAVGIIHDHRIVNGAVQGVQEADRPLETLLLTAIGTISTSAESLALRDALGGASSPKWLAYLEVRKQPQHEARRDRYIRDVLGLLVKLFYSATYVDQAGGKIAIFNISALQEAKNKIDEILAELPDPE